MAGTAAQSEHGHGRIPEFREALVVFTPTTRTSERSICCSRMMAGIVGGALSVGMRLELEDPGLQYFANPHMFNVFVTGHGLIMVFFMQAACAGNDRWLRQLVCAANDRRAGYGLPANEQHFVLVAAGCIYPATDPQCSLRARLVQPVSVPAGLF